MRPTSRNDRLCAALASILALAPSLAVAETVGTAGAANTRSAGKVQGRPPKLIEIGDQVVRDEKIETSATGSVQVVFIDRTTLNIGPNSSLIIDRFVYNPATSTGEMALTLGRGVLRLVGGQATHTGGATVNTPVATIGVRGGIATISHCPAHARCQPAGTLAVDHFGVMTVSAGGVTEEVLRPGFGVKVAAEAGATPGPPTRISQADIDGANALLTSRGTQKGGASRTPTDAIARADGLGGYTQTTTATAVPRQAQTSAAVFTASALPAADLVHSVQGTVQQGVTQAGVAATTPPSLQPSAYALMTTAGAGSSIPFLTASFATSGQAYVSPVYGYSVGGPSNGPVDVPASPQFGGLQPSNPSRNFQASLVIDGSGATQTSTLAVMTGMMAGIGMSGQSSPTYVQTGQFRATGRGSSAMSTFIPLFAEGEVSSTTNAPLAVASIPANAAGLPSGAFPVSQNALTFNSASATASAVANVAVDDVTGSYTYGQTLSPVAAPAGLGSNHPSETLQGYVGAIGQSLVTTSGQIASGAPLPVFIVTNQSNSPGDVSISLYGNSSRLAAEFDVRNATAVGATGELQSAAVRFGEPPSTATTIYQAGQSAYVDLTHFAALEQRLASNGGVSVATSTINGKPVALSNQTLVNAASVNAASFFPGVSFCQCDYTQWGLWSMLAVDSNTTFHATGIGFWVAGLPTATSDINSAVANNVTATYSGHVIAAIANGPNNPLKAQFPSQYIAAGNFTNTVNFGARTGSISVPNLDGASYAGKVALGANTALFAGTLPGSIGSRVMSVNGTFFQGATSPYGEMGGNVAVTGTNYLASGIFAAKKR